MPETVHVRLCVDGAGCEEIGVEPVSSAVFRLAETPAFATDDTDPLWFDDVVELAQQPDGRYRFVRIVARSPMQHLEWLLPRHFVESVECRRFEDAVTQAGGMWERVGGGLLYVHLPTESSFDAQAELDRAVAASAR